MPSKHRYRSLFAGGLLGLCAALLQDVGCILPDYCIRLNVLGDDYCTNTLNAMMWPIGAPELAEPIQAENGSAPAGCECLNATEVQWVLDEVPEQQLLALLAEIHQATRNQCASLVPPGFNHNCYDGEIVFGAIFVNDGPTKSDSCFHSCSYFKPPPNGSCPHDPNPFECNEMDGGVEGSSTQGDLATGTGETGGVEGSDTQGDLDTGTDETGGTTAGFGEREVQW